MIKRVKDKLKFITELVRDIQNVRLSEACGKYYDLVDNGDEIIAISFAGKYGYNTTPLKKLDSKTIDIIYNDLREDFDD